NALLGKVPIIIDVKSGVPGAGRKVEPMYLYSAADESVQAYGLKGHRHQPEIVQEWQRAAHDARNKTRFYCGRHGPPVAIPGRSRADAGGLSVHTPAPTHRLRNRDTSARLSGRRPERHF